MNGKPRCKKCGRVLKSPLSIALGTGPKCARISLASGQGVSVGNRPSFCNAYHDRGTGGVQTPLTSSDNPEKNMSKKELFLRQRAERRLMFEQRQSFQCGFLAREKTPLIYEPMGERDWKDGASGKILSHERLQDYLIRYQFI
jgi:hypothetical protein